MNGKNRTRTTLLLALGALAALALLAPAWPGARLSLATGAVEVGRGEPPVWKSAQEGDALGAGDRVRTGEDGRAEIALDGSTLRLYPNSTLRLPGASEPGKREVEMDRGTSLFDVLRRGDSFEVRTPEVVVSVKGTRFGVGLDEGGASVAVYRGVVGVRGEHGHGVSETLVHEGFSAFGSDAFQLRWHGSDDPWEGWSRGDLAPGSLERGAARGAALRDARKAAIAMSKELPHGKRDARGRGDGKGDRKHAPPAHAAEPGQRSPVGGGARDGVADADKALDQTLGQKYVEEVVSAATGGAVDLDVTLLDSSGRSGPDAVMLHDPASGGTWTFDEDAVEDILDGEVPLPQDLAALLAGSPEQDQKALLRGLSRLLK